MKFSAALLATFVFGLSVSARAEKIEDNSFLVEEAYNQEPGVIQHIFTWQKKRKVLGTLPLPKRSRWVLKTINSQRQFHIRVPLTPQVIQAWATCY